MKGMPMLSSRALLTPAARWVKRHWIRHDELVRVRQQLRYLAYAELLGRYGRPVDLSFYELSVFSQNGEDGVLREIFARIGVEGRKFLEIGASANEANAVLLADLYGWSGVFCDSSPQESSELLEKYECAGHVSVSRVHCTPENFAQIVDSAGGSDLDLLSIDVDGNDYWLWANIGSARPRVVVIEYDSGWPANEKYVQPYSDTPWDGLVRTGSSRLAFEQLGETLGYRLVHAESTGVNLFFVRDDLVAEGKFVMPEEVAVRVPNHYLYGLMHARRE